VSESRTLTVIARHLALRAERATCMLVQSENAIVNCLGLLTRFPIQEDIHQDLGVHRPPPSADIHV